MALDDRFGGCAACLDLADAFFRGFHLSESVEEGMKWLDAALMGRYERVEI